MEREREESLIDPEVGVRIRRAREFRRLTLKELAREIGISWVTLQRYEKGHRIPKKAVLHAIANILGVDLNWLLTGRGEMLPHVVEKKEVLFAPIIYEWTAENMLSIKRYIDSRKFIYRPYIVNRLKGINFGPVEYFSREKALPVPASFNDPTVFAVRVHDDSMAPRFNPGDFVVVSPRSEVKSGDIALVVVSRSDKFFGRHTAESLIRQVVFTDEEKILLTPLNPRYKPLHISRSRVVIIGKVLLLAVFFEPF